MHVDPVFASWVRTGRPWLPGSPHGSTEAERFAAYERIVMRRTNGLFETGRLALPWPRRLGTPPWGALREMEYGASALGTQYTVGVIRTASAAGLVAVFDTLVEVVAEGEPALLYVGNAVAPRHVVLLLRGHGNRPLDVYDPASGRVGHLRRDAMVAHRLSLSGWDVGWIVVRPTGAQRVRARSYAPDLGAAPA
ncbi:MAG: hypothetical protein ACRCYX_00920 [Dermatophilaceae bacterium]